MSILQFIKTSIVGGLVVVLPVVVIWVIAAKAVEILKTISEPVVHRLPEAIHFPTLIAVMLLLLVCFAAGVIARTRAGQSAGRSFERQVLERIPGYSLVRSLTRRVAGTEEGESFASALAVIEDALVPAFIVEHHPDGRYTVFVPSAPTPGVGAIYILPPDRVHPLDVPFIKTVGCITKWGAGSAELLGAMRPPQNRADVTEK